MASTIAKWIPTESKRCELKRYDIFILLLVFTDFNWTVGDTSYMSIPPPPQVGATHGLSVCSNILVWDR